MAVKAKTKTKKAALKIRKPTQEEVHKANMGGLWVVLLLMLGFGGLALERAGVFDDDVIPMAAMYAEPMAALDATDARLEELWADLCELQEQVGVEQNKRCE